MNVLVFYVSIRTRDGNAGVGYVVTSFIHPMLFSNLLEGESQIMACLSVIAHV